MALGFNYSRSGSREKTVGMLDPTQQALLDQLAPFLGGQLGQISPYTAGLWNQLPGLLSKQMSQTRLPSAFGANDRDIIDRQSEVSRKTLLGQPGMLAGQRGRAMRGIEGQRMAGISNLLSQGQLYASQQRQAAQAMAMQLMGMQSPDQQSINNILALLGIPTTTQQGSSYGKSFGANISAPGGSGSVGAFLGGLISSKSFKENIEELSSEDTDKILDSLSEVDIVTYNYKPEIVDDGRKQHVGVIVENIPQQLVTPDGKQLDMVDTIGFLIASVKSLNAKVKRLEAQEA